MIGWLQGTPEIVNNQVLIKTPGVGYLVRVSPRVQTKLSRQDVSELYIYTHVREDQLDLYGFETWAERTLFELIIAVSGVGPATAIQILNHDISSITSAIQEADVAFFSAIPRIGKKVAQKIIIELGSKLGEVKALHIGPQNQAFLDIKESLVALGFNPESVAAVLDDLHQETNLQEQKPELVIKKAIALLGKK
jgi:Holliday junction DNA helicase RuvA